MSTKIYEAYRTKRGVTLFQFIAAARPGLIKTAKRRMKEWVLDGTVKGTGFMERSMNLHALFHETLKSSLRSEFDLRASLSFRELRGRYYIIPLTGDGVRDVFKGLKHHPMLEDFSYWNNTDAPDGMSGRTWRYRGKIWNELDSTGWNNSVHLSIIDLENWSEVVYRGV